MFHLTTRLHSTQSKRAQYSPGIPIHTPASCIADAASRRTAHARGQAFVTDKRIGRLLGAGGTHARALARGACVDIVDHRPLVTQIRARRGDRSVGIVHRGYQIHQIVRQVTAQSQVAL